MPQLLLMVSTVVWGATFPATKVALAQIPPFSFLFLRFLLGAVCVLGTLLAVGHRLRRERGILAMSAVATLFLFLGYAAQTVGLQYTTASNSAFITALYVVLVPLFLRRFEGRIWVPVGLAVTGLWLLVHPIGSLNVGDLWTLLCAAAFAGHIICLEAYTRRGDIVSLLAWQLVFVSLAVVPAMVREAPHAVLIAPTPELLVGLAVTGVLATGALAIQLWAQKFLPAQQVAVIFSLEPVFAAWLAWYFLGERLEPSAWMGSGLILGAVVSSGAGKTGDG